MFKKIISWLCKPFVTHINEHVAKLEILFKDSITAHVRKEYEEERIKFVDTISVEKVRLRLHVLEVTKDSYSKVQTNTDNIAAGALEAFQRKVTVTWESTIKAAPGTWTAHPEDIAADHAIRKVK